MHCSNLEELHESWSQLIERYTSLRAQYLFYSKLKELVQGRTAHPPVDELSALGQARSAQEDLDFVADVSRVEIEKDGYYEQVISSLRSEIRAEKERGTELHKLVSNALLEAVFEQKTRPYLSQGSNIETLEEKFSELEQQLNECTDATTRVDELADAITRVEGRRTRIQALIVEKRKALSDTEQFLTTLQSNELNEHDDSHADSMTQLNKLAKVLL